MTRRARTVEDSRMTLIDHIKELRRRLFIALLGIMIVTIVIAVWAYHPIFNFLRHPYCELPPVRRAGGKNCDLIFTHPTDAFFVRLRVSLISGVLFSAPIWLYELWAFITPGLHRNERRWTLAFLASATVLFAAGATMAYLFLRTALNFLLGFGGSGIKSLLTVTDYLSFVTHLLIVFGASFLFPLVIILLNLAGVLSAKRLAKYRRIEIFLVFVFAGFVTPSGDPFTMPALAVVLCLFYEAAILFAKWNDRRRARRDEMSEFADLADTEASPEPVLEPIEMPRPVEPPRASVSAGWGEDDIT
ncbi:MAG TPA: twin-arginine translocase subunit TatC [Frankiaceae bacterium]|nr:twin-arginine translocase subunit TatC [Frankiaceae bacterium]